jgi:hypothetical protein
MNIDLLYEKWEGVECFSDGECIDCPNHTECRRLILSIQMVQLVNEICDTLDEIENLLEGA